MEGGDNPAACLSARGSWPGIQAGMGGLDPQHKIGVVGLPAEGTAGCRLLCTHAGAGLAHTSTAERQRTAPSALAAVWKFHGFLKKRAEVESIQPN